MSENKQQPSRLRRWVYKFSFWCPRISTKLSTLALLPLATIASMHIDQFKQCLTNIEKTALESGISQKTINAGLKTAQFLPDVIQLDRSQPEFQKTFSQYISLTVSASRIEEGRLHLEKYNTLLNQLRMEFGVPPHTLIAFWGLESNFGRNLGHFIIPDALATLACDTRRSAFFTRELIAALQLMDSYAFKKNEMIGSWAGAAGHTQLLPSNYLKYAISHDRKSIPNLWNSVPDALTSAARFLSELGWKKNWKWGREVYVPDNFDYRQSGIKISKPLADWHQLGIRTVFNDKIPEYNIAASLLLPGGHQNPAFLVYDNFHVIMKWNRSIFYALSVGYLADRLNKHRPLHKPLTEQKALAKKDILALQNKLNDLGFSCGKADGLTGSATYHAIREYQHSKDMISDGYLSDLVFKELNINRH